MSTSSDETSSQVETEAEGTRAELASTLEQLRTNLQPENVVDEVFFNAKIGASTLSDRAWSIAKEHPIPALLIAAGAAMILGIGARAGTASQPEPTYPDGAPGLPRPRQLRNPTVFESLRRGTVSIASSLGGRADVPSTSHSGARSGPARTAADFRNTASTSFGAITMPKLRSSRPNSRPVRFAQPAPSQIPSLLRDQPLILGAIGVAVGAAIGAALPITETEDTWMGSTAHSVKQAAQDVAQHEVEELKAVASRAVDNVKQSVESRGLSTDNLSGLAQDVGKHAQTALHEASDALDVGRKPS